MLVDSKFWSVLRCVETSAVSADAIGNMMPIAGMYRSSTVPLEISALMQVVVRSQR